MKNKNSENEKVIHTMTGIGYKKLSSGRKKERKVIQNLVFSDGLVIEKEVLPRVKNIDESMKKLGVEEIESKIIKIKGASYIVMIKTQKEKKEIGNLKGNFDIIKDIDIYQENSNDKEAQRKIRQTLKYISDKGKNRDYSSLSAYIATYGIETPTEINYQKDENIYTLKKQKA